MAVRPNGVRDNSFHVPPHFVLHSALESARCHLKVPFPVQCRVTRGQNFRRRRAWHAAEACHGDRGLGHISRDFFSCKKSMSSVEFLSACRPKKSVAKRADVKQAAIALGRRAGGRGAARGLGRGTG